jgi:hypothetical protein
MSAHWMGNHVYLQPTDGTELTLVQWCRPNQGVLRGFRVLDRQHLDRALSALEHATAGRREHLRLDGLAGRPLDLEKLLLEVGT